MHNQFFQARSWKGLSVLTYHACVCAVGVPGSKRGDAGLLPRRLVLLDPSDAALQDALPPCTCAAPQV